MLTIYIHYAIHFILYTIHYILHTFYNKLHTLYNTLQALYITRYITYSFQALGLVVQSSHCLTLMHPSQAHLMISVIISIHLNLMKSCSWR